MYISEIQAQIESREPSSLLIYGKPSHRLSKKKRLKGIAIECSYSNEQPESQIYGHLTPRLLTEEMENLEKLVGEDGLKGLNLIITHIKPKKNIHQKVKTELNVLYKKGIKIIFAEQGKVINL